MPTYEFACPSGHRFDKFYRKMSDAMSVLPCPECGAEATRQLSGGAGLIFKGSGFYITDYGKDGKKAQPSAAKKDRPEGTTAKDGGDKGSSGASGGSDKPGTGGSPPSGGTTGE